MTLAPERAPQRTMVGCPSRRPTPPPPSHERPQLAEGVTLLGEYAGTGYVEPQYLAARAGGQQVQLSRLLHLVADECDGRKTYDEIAERVTEGYGKTVSADNVRTLVNDKLRPLGVLADAAGNSPDVETPDLMLGLKLRREILHAPTVRTLAKLVTPIFWPPVVLAVLAGLVAVDYWLFFVHGVGEGIRSSVQQPAVFLLVAAVVVTSAALHEFGHAAACTYSGGKPGGMGMGIYLVWPAFYTDVTDAYQLDRRGRLRTDLGGVYVNAMVVLTLAGIYAATRFEPLVLLMFLLQIQVLQQMLPFLRLDGYYVVSDLVGVPDLFRRIGPVLRSAIPFRKREPEVDQLKPWVRRAVTTWVLIVVPLLLLNLGYILLALPRIAATSWDSASRLVGQLGNGGSAGTAWTVVQLALLALPALGITYTLLRVTRKAGSGAWRWSEGSAGRRLAVGTGALLLVGVLAVAWFPDGRVTPYREGESSTIQTQLQELETVGQGTPLLRTPEQAQDPLAPVPSDRSAVTDPPADEPAPGADTTSETSPTPSSDPVPEQSEAAPSPSSAPSAEASFSAPAEPSPAPSAEPSTSPSP